MSEFQIVTGALKKAARRRRLERVWRGFWQGLLVAGLLWVIAYGVYKVAPIPQMALNMTAIVCGTLMIAILIWAAARKLTLGETARWIDQRQKLHERLSTALELSNADADENWKSLVLNDAAAHVKEVDARKLVPIRLPLVGKWALLVAVLAVGLGFVPEYRSKKYLQQQQDLTQIRETGKKLAEVTRRNLDQRPPALEPTQKSIESLAELGEKLSKASLTRSEALRELNSVSDKLSQEAKQLSENPALKRMEQAAREPGGTAGGPAPEGLQKQIQSLQDKLGKAANNASALEQAKNALQKAQQSLANLGDQNSPEAQAAREQLSASLGELAQQMRDMGMPMPDLDEAIRAFQNNQTDLVVRNLESALNDLEKFREMAKALEKLQQQAEGVGKDLPEQLKFGQTQAAQQRLEKMSEQLKSGQLSKEQLEKMLDEVSRAVDPGSQYGKVGDLLKQAAGEMQQGNSSKASEALAQAAKELEKMGQQMADAQALMAALDALDRAQMAIAMGKNWEQCQGEGCKACQGMGCAQCRRGLGWNHGGRPGAGVGTWADETGWMDVPNEQVPVDNSGINRPDMDPRGIADRPANLNPNLMPSKVRGQMGQGGPMPSITLKGVSIKGQSSIEFQEAATAAQQDAQSALNQDKVPRAYQNAVRDYFDDLKNK